MPIPTSMDGIPRSIQPRDDIWLRDRVRRCGEHESAVRKKIQVVTVEEHGVCRDPCVHVGVDTGEVRGLVGALPQVLDADRTRRAEGVVIVENIAVEELDRVDPGLRDLVEDVASRAAKPDDPDLLATESSVQRREAGPRRGGVAIHEREIVLDLLPRRPGSRCDRRVYRDGGVRQDSNIRRDLGVLVGVGAALRLAGDHVRRNEVRGDAANFRRGARQRLSVLGKGLLTDEPNPVVSGLVLDSVAAQGDRVGKAPVCHGRPSRDVRDLPHDQVIADDGEVVTVVEQSASRRITNEW